MMIFVHRVRILIRWNVPYSNALQIFNFIMKFLAWFNMSHSPYINLSPEQILLKNYTPGVL